MFSGTCVYGHRATGQDINCIPQSKKDGQTVCGRGQCGTCCTRVGQAPAENLHAPLCAEVGNCPRHPILVRCQWPDSVRSKTHAWLWNHREQLMSPDVSHPGREIQAESQKGRCSAMTTGKLRFCRLKACHIWKKLHIERQKLRQRLLGAELKKT